jgi:hypothetical protein
MTELYYTQEVPPEQRASILSRATYSYMDPLIRLANRQSNLSMDQLPELADDDRASHLIENSFSYLDPSLPGKRRHLYWGLITVFSYDLVFFFVSCSLLTIHKGARISALIFLQFCNVIVLPPPECQSSDTLSQIALSFAGPIVLNQLLMYVISQ